MVNYTQKLILRLLWKMVGNMFFQDIEQVGMENASPKKSTFSIEWRKTCSRGGGGGIPQSSPAKNISEP